MRSTPQPFWVSGKPLRAKDLVDLESYFFSQHQLLNKTFGIHDLNTETSITYSPNERIISVYNIEGLTESGHPVRIGEDGLSVSLEEPIESPIEIGIEVNPFYESYLDDGSQSKLVLRVGKSETVNSNLLSLGSYEILDNSNRVRLVNRPPVTHLCALKPWDDAWKAWTAPLSSVIVELNERVESMTGQRGVETLYAAVCTISFMWPHMLIQELSQQLQFAKWLHCLLMDRILIDGNPFELTQVPSFQSGDDLPSALSKLLNLEHCPDQFGQEINNNDFEIQTGKTEGEIILVFLKPVLPGTLKLHVEDQRAADKTVIERKNWSIKVENESGENQFVPLFDEVSQRASSIKHNILIYNIPLSNGIQRKRRLFIRFPNRAKLTRIFHTGKITQ